VAKAVPSTRRHPRRSRSLFSIDVASNFTWGTRGDTLLPPVELLPAFPSTTSICNWRAPAPRRPSKPWSPCAKLRRSSSHRASRRCTRPALQVRSAPYQLDLTLDTVGASHKHSDATGFTLAVTSLALGKTQDAG